MAEAWNDEAAKLSRNEASEMPKIPTSEVLSSRERPFGQDRNKASEMLKIPTSEVLSLSEGAFRLSRNKASEMLKFPSMPPPWEVPKASEMLKFPSMLPPWEVPKSSEMLKFSSSVALPSTPSSEGAFRQFRNKTSEVLMFPSSTVRPSWKGPKPSYFVRKSLAKMVDEDPIRLQNQSCAIRGEAVKTREGLLLVYSSLARLPTFSIGLSSTSGEKSTPAPFLINRNSVDPKDQSPPRFFQMPELGARVFVGNVDGVDTITCHLLDNRYYASKIRHSEFAAVRSVYKGGYRGKLSGWIRAQPSEFSTVKDYVDVILSGTELFSAFTVHVPLIVGNLGGKGLRGSGCSPDYEDCGSDETIGQPSDVVEQPEDHVPGVLGCWPGFFCDIEGRNLFRLPEGSYLRRPEFMKLSDRDLKSYGRSETRVLQLTRFDDFIILGDDTFFKVFLDLDEITNIVRKNASETADVIAAQLVKIAIEKLILPCSITAIVIFLDHKEILLKEKENMAPKDSTRLLGAPGLNTISQSILLRDDEEIVESKEEEIVSFKEEEKVFALEDKKGIMMEEGHEVKILVGEPLPNVPPTLTALLEEKVFALEMEDKKGIMMEEDHEAKILVGDDEVKILVGEPLPNVPQILTASLEENELQMKSAPISSELASMEVQDNSKASSSTILIEDDCKNNDSMVSCHITKWIIYRDLQEITLLCFFNVEENKYEFYFEDHESMAAIIGLGVPHSKVVLEYGSPHVTVVEIPKEDWDVVRAHSNVIPLLVPKGNVLKQEIFPDILHCIANAINTDNIVSKANDGVGGNNGKDKLQGNANNGKGKGKACDHDDRGNTSHSNGSSNRAPNDNDNKERKEKDGNDDEKDNEIEDGGKTFNDSKEVQATVYVHLWPGGVLEERGKKKKLQKVNMEEGDEKTKEVHERVEKKKIKYLPTLRQVLKRSENGNVVGNHQNSTSTSGIENNDDESLQKQLKEQIHAEMVFTFTIKEEVGGQLKTIQATIDPITFQLPSKNKKNYLQRRRFGWFHGKMKVAFGVVNPKVAYLDAKSCKVLDFSEVEELSSKGTTKGNSRTNTNAYKGKLGLKQSIIASGEYNRTNGLEAKTTNEVQNSWKINKKVTKGDFFISDCINLNSGQLKYSYHPHSPFQEKEFEEKGEDDRLNMYHQNPICQPHQVSCEGTWRPYDSKNLEAYKLEASRELGMTRIYNSKLETVEEKKQKGVSKIEENLPICFIQKLEKVVYLNHSMSHLNCSSSGIYRLREIDVQSNPSIFLTQAQYNEKPKWPRNDPLVDVKQ